MVFLGSEKQAAAKELCLHQLMKRKPAISLQHSPHLGGEQSYLHPQHRGPGSGSWTPQGTRAGEHAGQAGWLGAGTRMGNRGPKGPRHQPAEMAAATSHAAWRLLPAAGGKADVLQLCLIKRQEKHSAQETDSIKEGAASHQAAASLQGPMGWGAGRQQMPGAHLSMGKAFWAEMLLFAAAEHAGRSNTPSRDLPTATPELWCDVPRHSPRHTWLSGTGNC